MTFLKYIVQIDRHADGTNSAFKDYTIEDCDSEPEDSSFETNSEVFYTFKAVDR